MKTFPYCRIAIALLVLTCSCRGSEDGAEAVSDTRLAYSAPSNVVEIQTLESRAFPMQILSNGKVIASQRAQLHFQTDGVIEQINYTNGQKVSQGAVIARTDRSYPAIALESARIAFDKSVLDLYDVLAGQGYTSRDTSSVPQDILSVAKMRSGFCAAKNSLAKAQRDYDGTELKAPFDGRLADLKLKRWDRAGAGEVFCTLLGDAQLDVDFTIMESDYPAVRIGMPVSVSGFGGEGDVKGSIISINPTVDKNGQIGVRARIANSGRFIDGMNVKIVIERSLGNMLVVPRSAVVIRDNLNVLFRYNNGKAEWVYVNILNANSDSFAVEANTDRGAVLNAGDKVIVSGNLNLADGSEVVLNN